jgi:hypothetical protein
MFIPGEVVSAVTFPGVIVHEAAHMFFCKLRRVAVFDMCFYRFGNPAGYIVHEPIENFNTAFLVCMGPFFINSLLCMAICFPAYLPMKVFHVEEPLSYFLLWLGLSIGMHAFPSPHDADALMAQAKKAWKSMNPLAILSFPLVILIYLGHISAIFWGDLLYGVGIGLGLPSLIFH